MFARNSIHIPLKNREGDQFVLTDEHAHFNHERLEFLTGQEAWDFIFALTSSQALQQRLKGHPSLKSYHQTPGGILLGKALEKGDLKVFVTHRDQSRNREKIQKLYDQIKLKLNQIKLKLNQIIASEKAEAALINKQYQAMSPAEQKMAHAGSFGKGLADAGISFLIWVKDVVEVASGGLKLIRQVKAHWNTPYEGSVFEWLEKADQTYREGEYKELVEALGFDPLKVNVEDFKQAWELALIIWDDEKCQSLLVQFTKDYYKAQHPLEASEFVGSAAFEVLLTILLILTTAGAGAVANVASKGRLLRQMNQLGDLFRDLARLKKQVYKHTPEKQTRSRSSGNMVEDLPEDDRPAPKASEPPKGDRSQSSSEPNKGKLSIAKKSDSSKQKQALSSEKKVVELDAGKSSGKRGVKGTWDEQLEDPQPDTIYKVTSYHDGVPATYTYRLSVKPRTLSAGM
ncbi:MAG: hypothetical protein ACR2PX_25990 [Endozoicomonas sp.]|uniref:hypothetical protein n=1 Tax=Endozoicomonas sp. TaxID=1892382 RepID=UPI003D9B3B03